MNEKEAVSNAEKGAQRTQRSTKDTKYQLSISILCVHCVS